MELSERDFDLFQNDDGYKQYIREKLALGLAKQILDSKMTTFTYMKHPHDFGATIHARINFQ